MNPNPVKVTSLFESLLIFAVSVFLFNLVKDIPLGMSVPVEGFPISYFSTLIFIFLFSAIRKRPIGYSPKLAEDQSSGFRLFAIAILPTFMIKGALFFLDWKQWIGALAVSLVIIVALIIVIGVSKNPAVKQTTLLALGGILIIQPLIQFNPLLPESPQFIYRFFYVGLVAITEESLFRGIIFSKLAGAFNKQWKLVNIRLSVALLTSSVLFGLWHVINGILLGVGIMQSFAWGLWTLFLGVFLGLLRMKSNRINLPAIMHWIINI